MLNLQQIIDNSNSISDINSIPPEYVRYLQLIGKNSEKRKGLYTVLTTLLYYKYLHPEQDVRRHQVQIEGGFSGRSFDTANVTPILKKNKLPSMAESGWLTRNLEQPYPYDFNYSGKIPPSLKMPFLKCLDYVQKNPTKALEMVMILLNTVINLVQQNQVTITPLSNPEKLTITKIMSALEEHFLEHYGTHNGAKLPVLAFYSIYSCLIKEMKRYEGCTLAPLSSLTACDRTNKASGDIEIFKKNSLFETIEIKLDKKIDCQIVRVVEEKIYKWNPQRYYILSVLGTKQEDQIEISNIIHKIGMNHGCQIIINGLLPTIKYYLRLITDINLFVTLYSKAVESDTELQHIHKTFWNKLIRKYDL